MPLKALAAWFAQMSRESPFAAIYLLLFIIIIFFPFLPALSY